MPASTPRRCSTKSRIGSPYRANAQARPKKRAPLAIKHAAINSQILTPTAPERMVTT
jgi:hypothetical protein